MSDSPEAVPDDRAVFVIHGRNERARAGLFAFLRSIGLDPIEWSEALAMTGEGSPYIGHVLDAAFARAQAVVVLQTPDDVAFLHPSLTSEDDPETRSQMQPRPNVLFEAGMAMGRDAARTILVELGTVKHFSDIHGRHVVRLDGSTEKRQALANRLRSAGCNVRLTGTDWLSEGDLTPPEPPGDGLPLGRRFPAARMRTSPKLDARYIANPSPKLDQIDIINMGPGDAFNVDIPAKQKGIFVETQVFPIPKLPEGKHVRVMHTRGHKFSDSNEPPYFTLTVTGAAEDGTELTEDIFLSY